MHDRQLAQTSNPYRQTMPNSSGVNGRNNQAPPVQLNLLPGQICHFLSLHKIDCLQVVAPVIELYCLVVAWLSLHAGISRDAANTVLKALHFITLTLLQLIQTALASSGIQITRNIHDINIPVDIRTVYSHCGLETEITQVVCCPKCFLQYPAGVFPDKCTWQRAP